MIITLKENFVVGLGPRKTIFKLLWASNCGTQNLHHRHKQLSQAPW